MDIQKNSFLSIDQLANQYLNNSRKTVKAAQENLVSFQEILQSKSNEQLKFSKHATVRLAKSGTEGNQGFSGDRGQSGIYCECTQ